MRIYKCRVYTSSGSYFDTRLEASDYWDAVRRVESQYPGLKYNYLMEA